MNYQGLSFSLKRRPSIRTWLKHWFRGKNIRILLMEIAQLCSSWRLHEISLKYDGIQDKKDTGTLESKATTPTIYRTTNASELGLRSVTYLATANAHTTVVQLEFLQSEAGRTLQQCLEATHTIWSKGIVTQVQLHQLGTCSDEGLPQGSL